MSYGTERSVERFRASNPDAAIVTYGACKAREMLFETRLRRGPGWILAYRTTFILTGTHIVCAPLEIPLDKITKAVLVRTKGRVSQGHVLKVDTAERHYQFGLEFNPELEQQTVLPLSIEEGTVGLSVLSLMMFTFALAYTIYSVLDLML